VNRFSATGSVRAHHRERRRRSSALIAFIDRA
jgi:hypothetical protein